MLSLGSSGPLLAADKARQNIQYEKGMSSQLGCLRLP